MADTKISALTELTTPINEDLLPIVDDPAGTPVTKKVTVANLFVYLASLVQTFTNKRNQKRIDSQTTTDTITPEISTYDIFIRTAQAHALVINNHSTSTPVDGEMMEFIITGDATPRAITYGNKYVAKSGTALPTTTVASKCTKMLFQWRASLSEWDLLTALQEE